MDNHTYRKHLFAVFAVRRALDLLRENDYRSGKLRYENPRKIIADADRALRELGDGEVNMGGYGV
jgi:hypothetical protein